MIQDFLPEKLPAGPAASCLWHWSGPGFASASSQEVNLSPTEPEGKWCWLDPSSSLLASQSLSQKDYSYGALGTLGASA